MKRITLLLVMFFLTGIAQAIPVSSGFEVNGELEHTLDFSVISFSVSEMSDVNIRTNSYGDPGFDTALNVLNALGELVGRNDDYYYGLNHGPYFSDMNIYDVSITFNDLAAGEYDAIFTRWPNWVDVDLSGNSIGVPMSGDFAHYNAIFSGEHVSPGYSVPEPTGLALVGLGLIGIGFTRIKPKAK